MNEYNVSFFRKGKRPEKNILVAAVDAQHAEAIARQTLGVADDRFRVQVQHVKELQPEVNTDPVEAAPPIAESTPSPTIAELGIDGEPADLLTEFGLTDLARVTAYGDLTKIKGIGQKTAADIRSAIAAYKQG